MRVPVVRRQTCVRKQMARMTRAPGLRFGREEPPCGPGVDLNKVKVVDPALANGRLPFFIGLDGLNDLDEIHEREWGLSPGDGLEFDDSVGVDRDQGVEASCEFNVVAEQSHLSVVDFASRVVAHEAFVEFNGQGAGVADGGADVAAGRKDCHRGSQFFGRVGIERVEGTGSTWGCLRLGESGAAHFGSDTDHANSRPRMSCRAIDSRGPPSIRHRWRRAMANRSAPLLRHQG